jgi:hypothetical protein
MPFSPDRCVAQHIHVMAACHNKPPDLAMAAMLARKLALDRAGRNIGM